MAAHVVAPRLVVRGHLRTLEVLLKGRAASGARCAARNAATLPSEGAMNGDNIDDIASL